MRETEKRIRLYTAMLPRARERVVAAFLVFLVSLSVISVSTFSWITFSVRPEVTGVATTITGNGNLEVALSDKDGLAPDATAVGDSALDLSKRNLTWGNIINLSDESYGLDDLVLRPAMLSPMGTYKSSPLNAMKYDRFGRVTGGGESLYYSQYNVNEAGIASFGFGEETYGVRAISSAKNKGDNYDDGSSQLITNAAMLLEDARQDYTLLFKYPGGKSETYMKTLSSVVSTYIGVQLGDNKAFDRDKIRVLNEMLYDLKDCYDKVGRAYEALGLVYINKNGGTKATFPDMYAAYVATKNTTTTPIKTNLYEDSTSLFYSSGKTTNAAITYQYLFTNKSLFTDDDTVANLMVFLEDYYTLATDIEKINLVLASGEAIYWNNISGVVNNLLDMNKCEVLANGERKTVAKFASDAKADIMGTLNSIKNLAAIVCPYDKNNSIYLNQVHKNNALLYNFEVLTGGKMDVVDLSVDVTYMITIPVDTDVYTDAHATGKVNLLTENIRDSASVQSGSTAGLIAADTYGLVVDFWIRTNASGSYLSLEGELETIDVPKTEIYKNEEVEVYEINIVVRDENGDPVVNSGLPVTNKEEGYAVKDESGNITGYIYKNGDPIAAEDISGTPHVITTKKPIGFSGTNRIWDEIDDSQDPENHAKYSTSQGSGSCYTFYCEAADLTNTLDMLAQLKVAFIVDDGDEGELLAIASFDTKNYFADAGRYVLPMIISSGGMEIEVLDEMGVKEKKSVITSLTKNQAQRITAIIYLDGLNLSNENVLASSNIQGNLNIQFGSSYDVDSLYNDNLYNETRVISAEIEGNIDSQNHKADYTGTLTKTLTFDFDGAEPNKIEAFFVRQINSMQGSRQKAINITKNGSYWQGDAVFAMPGKYVLRSVRLDGIDYELETPITVELEGEAIESITLAQGELTTVMTANSYHETTIRLKPAGDNMGEIIKLNPIVTFFNADESETVSATLKWNAAGYFEGKARFTNSGTYTLTLVEMRAGETYNILTANEGDPNYKPVRLTVTVGLKTEVDIVGWNISETEGYFEYLGGEYNVNMSAFILDSNGIAVEKLEGVSLTYYRNLSSVGMLYSVMTWNDTNKCYEGTFKITAPGNYAFHDLKVTIDGEASSITSAAGAPKIDAITKDPIDYMGFSAEEYQFVPNGNGVITAEFKDAVVGNYYAQITNGSVTYYIEGVSSNTENENGNYEYTFYMVDATGNAFEGTWTLVGFKVTGAFYNNVFYNSTYVGSDGKGVQADPANPDHAKCFIDFGDEVEDTDITVVKTFISYAGKFDTTPLDDKGDASYQVTGNGKFMTTHTFENTITLANSNGEIFVWMEDGKTYAPTAVQMKLTYAPGSTVATAMSRYGNYTLADGTGVATTDYDRVYNLTSTDGGKTWTYTDSALKIAGNYGTSLTVTLTANDGSTKTMNFAHSTAKAKSIDLETTVFDLPEDMPTTILIQSTKPTMTIESVTPTDAQVKVGFASTVGAKNVVSKNANGDYSVAAFISGSYDSSLVVLGDRWTYTAPTITLKLNDAGSNYSNAIVTLENTVSGRDNSFEFGRNGTQVSGAMGYASGGTQSPIKDHTGNNSISAITMVDEDGIYYKLNLGNSLSFVQKGETYSVAFVVDNQAFDQSSKMPSISYANADGTVTLTMPNDINSWTQNMQEASGDSKTSVSEPEKLCVYDKRIDFGKHNWFTYERVTTVTTTVGTTTTWTNTNQITGWKVGNTEYSLGQTVTLTLTEDTIVEALIESTEGDKTTTNSTTTHTVIVTTSTGSTTSYSNYITPSGYTKKDSVTVGTEETWS